MPFFKIILTVLLFILSSCRTVEEEKPVLSRIAFGSCLKIEHSTPQLWQSIRSTRPNLFIFAGDNVYADSREVKTLHSYYRKLGNDSGFRRLRSLVPMLAVYDDHDYGISDGGKENPIKDEAALACLDFFKVPYNDPRRQHKGVYGSYSYGSQEKKLQVILLDTRYFRDALVKTDEPGKRYAPNNDPAATMLGEEQWKWLEKTLKESADVRLIVSSIQVIPDKRGMESWGNFPHERQKLFRMIGSAGASGVIFLSGDAHFSEASVYKSGKYPFYEITSSAMAHHHNTKDGRPTKYSNFPNEFRLKGSDYTAGNFGLVKVDWQGRDTVVRVELRKTDGSVYFSRDIPLSELQP